jgi:hypothetical protein
MPYLCLRCPYKVDSLAVYCGTSTCANTGKTPSVPISISLAVLPKGSPHGMLCGRASRPESPFRFGTLGQS